MIQIAKSSLTSGYKKLLWSAGTFFPLVTVLAIAKRLQSLAPYHRWASELLRSTIGLSILVFTFLGGGWAVVALYNSVHKKKA